MATISRRVLRLIAVAGTVPAVGIAIGYRMRVQAAENSTSGSSRVYKTSELPYYPSSGSDTETEPSKPIPFPRNDMEELLGKCRRTVQEYIWLAGGKIQVFLLPLYPTGSSGSESPQPIPYPRNAVEEQIGVVRRAVQGFLGQFQDQFDSINSTAQTGIAHTKSGIEYIQNEQGELPRIAFIAIAGMGGVVLGSRGGAFKKLTYGSIAAISAASLSYPKKSVELTQTATNYVKKTWNDIGGNEAWEKIFPKENKQDVSGSEGTPVTELQSTESSENATSVSQEKGKNKQKKTVAGDPGQSNPNDKDMYSTRSS